MVCLELFVVHIASLCIGIQITTAQTIIQVNIPDYGSIQGSYTQPPGPAYQRVNRFLGIPYAKPPTGNRRFEPPETHDSWTQPRTATSFGSNCMQLNGAGSVVGSEDCLYLNIYVPGSFSTRVSSPIPVLVFIHGVLPGQVNSGDDYIGDQLTTEDEENPVILVSINYRFGVLGFATSGNSIIPGNMGYKDQAFAIQWVHDNIASFGGNDTMVTIFGQGSGGEAVKAHILSPQNVDMFQQAIVQSGGPLWTYPDKMAHEQVFDDFGNHLGCMGDSTGIRDCLRDVGATSIVEVTSEEVQHLERLTKPVIDGQFMPRNPHEILMDGSYNAVDFMVGFNSDDGSIFATMYETDYPNFLSGVPANHASIDAALSGCLHAAGGSGQPQELLALIQDEYLEPAATNLENTRAVLDMVRDCMFVSHSLEMVEKFATDGQRTYVYVFNHRTDSLPDPDGQVAMAAPHKGELPYVFGTAARLDQPSYSSNEQIISQSMMRAWYTFATSGAPTFYNLGYNPKTWTAYTPASPMILSFDEESLSSSNAMVSAETTWVPVSQFWALVREEIEEEGEENTSEQPEALAQSESSKEFKTDIFGLDEFEADLAVILLAVAVLLLLFAVLVLLCKVCRCCDSKEEKYYDH